MRGGRSLVPGIAPCPPTRHPRWTSMMLLAARPPEAPEGSTRANADPRPNAVFRPKRGGFVGRPWTHKDRAWDREPSERADVPSCLIRRCGHVDAVGPASRRRICGESVRGPFEESLRPDLVPAGSMGERNADLRKSLPQIRLLGRSSLPTRFKDLMGCERAASVDELSSLPERLLRRQGFLRHRLDAPGAIGQWSAQRVSRPGLTSTSLGVPITLSSSHTTRVPEKRSPDCLPRASLRQSSSSRVPRAVMQMCAPAPDP